jgi:medium-chain acyl-[acyl-carrier-protein] hydrolase
MMHRRSKSIRVIRQTPAARIRLICFSYAGSGPSIFNDWKQLLPPNIDLVGVVYPGREDRSEDPLSTDLRSIASEIARDMQAFLDKPFAFFGHSMGAYVCFEVAEMLAATGALPEHLFLSGAGAPHTPEPDLLHHLSSAQLLTRLVRMNGIPAEVLRCPELVKWLLPILRADFTACESYRYLPVAPSRCPMSVFGGSNDARVTPDRLHAWKQLSGVSFSVRMFEGDHFFLRAHKEALLSCMTRELMLSVPGWNR